MSPQELNDVASVLKEMNALCGSSQSDWLPVIAAIGGALIGALASFIPSIAMEKARLRNEAKLLEAALVAEVRALVEVAEARQYLKTMDEVITLLKAQPEGTTYPLTVRVPAHYSRIYQATSDRIGLIHLDTAVAIVRFHQLMDAVVQDVIPGGALSAGAPLESYERTKDIFAKALLEGRGIASRT